MPIDPIAAGKGMPDYGRILYNQIGKLSEGMPIDALHSAIINILANSIRMTNGKRTEAHERVEFVRAKLLERIEPFYDPVTNRRRSTIPFTQLVGMPHHADAEKFNRGGNGR
jgi:hypothetical protein